VRPAARRWAFGAWAALAVSALAAQAPGDTAPDFRLKTLAGDSVRLADLRGHPVVVNFWATWCPPCRYEIPLLADAYQAHAADSLIVLGVNGRDQELSTRAVQKFVADLQVPFPVLLDEKGRVRRRYRLRGLPTTVFVGPDGRVRAVIQGPFTAEALQQNLTALLGSP
jgi:cytochrome c biogenesis protein CcmG/thiol:disulfide interchange protein DsbE